MSGEPGFPIGAPSVVEPTSRWCDETAMTRAIHDLGRAEVYGCELAAFDGTDLEDVRSFDEIVAVVQQLVGGGWWPGPSVSVEAARRGAESSATHGPVTTGSRGSSVLIRFAAAQATIATAAHELAHALAGVAHGHDEVYRRAYLDVVEVITNLDPTDRRGETHVHQLAEAFAAARLSVGQRSWPAPPGSSGAIAL
jgi:hypothetical protein